MSHPRAADFGTGRGEPTFTLLFLPHHLITRLHQVRRHTLPLAYQPERVEQSAPPNIEEVLDAATDQNVKGTTARLSNYYGR